MGWTRFPHKMNIFGFKGVATCLSRLRLLRMDWMHKSLNSRVPLPPLPYLSKVNISCLFCSLLVLWEKQLTCVNMPTLPVDVLTASLPTPWQAQTAFEMAMPKVEASIGLFLTNGFESKRTPQVPYVCLFACLLVYFFFCFCCFLIIDH